MKVRLTVELNDRARRALNARVGKRGLATRADVRAHVDLLLEGDISHGVDELEAREAQRRRRR